MRSSKLLPLVPGPSCPSLISTSSSPPSSPLPPPRPGKLPKLGDATSQPMGRGDTLTHTPLPPLPHCLPHCWCAAEPLRSPAPSCCCCACWRCWLGGHEAHAGPPLVPSPPPPCTPCAHGARPGNAGVEVPPPPLPLSSSPPGPQAGACSSWFTTMGPLGKKLKLGVGWVPHCDP